MTYPKLIILNSSILGLMLALLDIIGRNKFELVCQLLVLSSLLLLSNRKLRSKPLLLGATVLLGWLIALMLTLLYIKVRTCSYGSREWFCEVDGLFLGYYIIFGFFHVGLATLAALIINGTKRLLKTKPSVEGKARSNQYKLLWYVVILPVLVILALPLILFAVSLSTLNGDKPLQAQGGMTPEQIKTDLAEETQKYFDSQLTALGVTNQHPDPYRSCYVYQYIGGVWDPPAPELQCSISFEQKVASHRPNTDKTANSHFIKILNKSDNQATSDGFRTRTDQYGSCYPPEFAGDYDLDPATGKNVDYPCFRAQKGSSGKGKQITPLCNVDISHDNTDYKDRYSYKLSVKCLVRATERVAEFDQYDNQYN